MVSSGVGKQRRNTETWRGGTNVLYSNIWFFLDDDEELVKIGKVCG
jgi:hypothetical protein